MLRKFGQRRVDGEGVGQLVDPVVLALSLQIFERLLTRRGAETVDAEPPRQRREPGPERVVVAEGAQALIRPGEGVLEDILGVVGGQPERLRDRVDVARVALDELAPGVGVAGAATCDELGVRDHGHIKQESAGKRSPMGSTTSRLERIGDSEWVERLGRIGLVAKGISFALVGVLAVLVALGAGGAATDREGTLRLLSKEWYGVIMLIALGLGFGAYAAWRLAQALLDRDDEGNDFEGWAKRTGALAKGLFYAGLSLLAFSFVSGPRGESRDEPEQTARVFDLPLGRWLVLALGLGLIAYGLANGYRSITGRFRKHLKTGQMEREDVKPLVNVAGFLGHAARMVLFSMVGIFLVRAAWQYDPKEAIGLDEALSKLAHQPYGPVWLGAAAVGLFAYGVFSVLSARYRDI